MNLTLPAVSISSAPTTAIVTGANHFIGIHLARALVIKKIHVFGLPSYCHNQQQPPSDLFNSPYFHYHPGITDYNALKINTKASGISQADFNYIFLTDVYSAQFSKFTLNSIQISSLLDYQFNLMPTQNAKSKISFFFPYINTLLPHPPKPLENLNLDKFLEKLKPWHSSANHNFRIIKLADVYGPNYDFASSTYIAEILRPFIHKKQTTIKLNQQQLHYPLYIDDAVQAILISSMGPQTSVPTLLLVGVNPITTTALLAQIKSLVNLSSKVHLKSTEPDLHAVIDPEEIIHTYKLLNYRPAVSLKQGLIQTFNHLDINTQTPLDVTSALASKSILPAQKTRFSADNYIEPLYRLFTQLISGIRKLRTNLRLFKFTNYQLLNLSVAKNLITNYRYIFITTFTILLLSPLAFIFAPLANGIINIKSSYQALQLNQTQTAAIQAQLAQRELFFVDHTIGLLSPFTRYIPPLKHSLSLLQQQTSLAHTFSQTIASSALAIGYLDQTLDFVFKTTYPTDPRLPLARARLHLDKTSANLGYLQAVLPTQPGFLASFLFTEQLYHDFQTQIPQMRRNISQLQNVLTHFPLLAGYQQPRTYLVLIQNNSELRPTGGYISSLGLATFDQGKLKAWNIHDVSEADSRLLGHVEPPDAIQTYLGETNWYLRDSNWDPDFPTSARQAQWFISKELQQPTAGVIALDADFINQLISSLGPVYVTDLKTSFFDQKPYSTERYYESESNDKRPMASIFDSIVYQITASKESNWTALASVAGRGFQQKQIQAYINLQPVQEILAANGWDGSLLAGINPALQEQNVLGQSTSKISDHLYLVEANLGLNQVNQYVDREIHHHVDIEPEEGITETLNLFYTNHSDTQTWQGGTYKNYLRLYLPLRAELLNVKVGEQDSLPLQRGGQEGSPLENTNYNNETMKQLNNENLKALDFIDQTTENGYRSYGFLVQIPIQTRYRVQVQYQLPLTNPEDEINYQLLIRKQPGASLSPYRLTIAYPDNYQPTNSGVGDSFQRNPSPWQGGAGVGNSETMQQFNHEFILDSDQTITLSLTKQKIRGLQ